MGVSSIYLSFQQLFLRPVSGFDARHAKTTQSLFTWIWGPMGRVVILQTVTIFLRLDREAVSSILF